MQTPDAALPCPANSVRLRQRITMVDDLSRPLMGVGGRQRRRPSPVVLVLAAVAAAAALGAALWFLVLSDRGDDAAPAANAARPAEGPGEVVISGAGAAAEGADGVTIMTPDGVAVDGNGPAIRSVAPAPVSLSPTPLPELEEPGPYGPIPRVSADGVRPFDAYARPVGPIGGQPVQIAIVVGGMGINQANSELVLEQLPGEMSLAIAPYGDNLAAWAARAREAGHELLLQVPLEPYDFPASDPGPQTLLADDPAADNIDRLKWLMAQVSTYAGIVSYAGGRFLADEDAMAPVVGELADRGLMFLDEGTAVQSGAAEYARGVVPFAGADMAIDREVSAGAIAARLAELETIAQQRGYAIATANAFQVTIEQLRIWAAGAAERGFVLVPVTALANDPRGDATTIEVE